MLARLSPKGLFSFSYSPAALEGLEEALLSSGGLGPYKKGAPSKASTSFLH